MLIDAARGGSPWPVSAHAPLDCYVAGPSVAAPIDVATVRGGFVNAAASVLRRVLGIAAPATLAFQAAPPLLFFSSPPAGLPKALWKACGKDENETRAHFERIQRLGCSDAERERILERYPNVHKIVLNEGYGFEEKTVLAHVDKNPQPAERFEVFADLVDATLRGSQGFDDLQMLEDACSKTGAPLVEAGSHLAVLRKVDHARDSSYSQFENARATMDFILAGTDSTARSERRALVESARRGTHSLDDAVEHAKILQGLPEKLRKPWLRTLKTYRDNGLLAGLKLVAGAKNPQQAFEHLSTLLKATQRPAQAVTDFGLAERMAAKHHSDRGTVIETMEAFRKSDSARDDSYSSFGDIEPTLEHVLSGPTPNDRERRAEAVLGLQLQGRGPQRALALQEQIQAMSCDDAQKRAVYEHLRKLAKHWHEAQDVAFLNALQACDGAAAVACYVDLVDATRRPEQATEDLKLCQQLATQHKLSLSEVTENAVSLRKGDPARDDSYSQFAELRPPLEATLAAGDKKARARAQKSLTALQIRGRDTSAALALQQAVQKIPATAEQAERIFDTLRGVLKHTSSSADGSILSALQDVAKTPAPDEAFTEFARLVKVTNRAAQGLDDFRLVAGQAASSGCPRSAVCDIVERLRGADPAREDSYSTFADLHETMDTLLAPRAAVSGGKPAPPASTELDQAVERFLRLQKHDRNPVHALAYEKALAALPCSAEERQYAREACERLVKKWHASSDADIVGMLGDTASGAIRPRINNFLTLLDASHRPSQAREDLRLAAREAGPRKLVLEECAGLLGKLREKDPARKESYCNFDDASATLAWVLDAPSAAERGKRAEEITELQSGSRKLQASLDHLMRLHKLHCSPQDQEAVRKSYVKALGKARSDADQTMLAALDAIDGQPDAPGQMEIFRGLPGIRRSADTALKDLKSVQTGSKHHNIGADDVASLITTMRKAEPEYVYRPESLSAPLEIVLQGTDDNAREARADGFATLWKKDDNLASATQYLEWVVATPAPRGIADGVRKLSNLVGRTNRDAGTLRTLYERMQAAAKDEPSHWWTRLLRLHGPYERTVYKVAALNSDAEQIVSVMDTLTAHRLPDESLRKSLKRFKQLLACHGEYEDPNVKAARQAFSNVDVPVAWGQWSPSSKWDRMLALAREWHSPEAADACWKGMAAAGSEGEFNARHDVFAKIMSAVEHRPASAARVFNALMTNVGASDSLAALLPTMEQLLRMQTPEVAAETWLVTLGTKHLGPDERAAVTRVLDFARSADEIHGLFAAVQNPVAGESFAVRAQILEQLLHGNRQAKSALSDFAAIRADLQAPGAFESTATAYAGLISVLRSRDLGLDEGRDLLKWVRDLTADDPDAPSLNDLLMTLTSHLVMGADVDNAKHLIRVAEDRRRNMKMSGGKGGRIEIGEEEINVGGVKVKVCKDG